LQDGIDAIEEVIYHNETYDVTTIRASTPMFLMARKIKALGVKMVLSGEGSDELLGGYLYFHFAPNKEEFHKETCRKVKALHQYDCLRANKATSAWGLEVRVPFLDKEFIDVAMSMDPEWKLVNMIHLSRRKICALCTCLLCFALNFLTFVCFCCSTTQIWAASRSG
jgi:asparagine synthase (glutamine-hydrolysing)